MKSKINYVKKATVFIMVVVIIFTIGGCGTKKPSSSENLKKQEVSSNGSRDIMSIQQPTRKITNKKLSFYTWITLEQMRSLDPEKAPNAVDILEKQYGVTVDISNGTHETYWEQLSTLIASNSAPDIVLAPNWNFYPRAITGGSLQPLDNILDFSKPLWDDGKVVREKLKWQGKTYLSFGTDVIQNWFFFNKKIFEDNGLETPYDFYKKGEWNFATLKDLAVKLTQDTDKDGVIDQFALCFTSNLLLSSAGIDLVEPDIANGYKFNIRDERIAKVMNFLFDLGNGGVKVLRGGPDDFRNNKLAMIAYPSWAAFNEFNKLRLDGNLGWVPMPAIDKNSQCYNCTAPSSGYGICKGAKNTEAAALFIELEKWQYLGLNPNGVDLVIPESTPYMKKYPESIKKIDVNKTLTKEEADMTLEMGLSKNKGISIIWQSWLQTQDMGYLDVTANAQSWSTVLEKLYPKYEAQLKSYFEK
jgi:ABC-type glycerol-3-phosphate transport system substrate-binding protein